MWETALEFLARRVLTDIDGELYLRNGGVKVRDVLKVMDHGLSRDKVLAHFPTLHEADIYTCKALATMAMDDRPEYRRNKGHKKPRNGRQHQPIKFLFDENLSWRIVPELVNNISEVSHILLEDMGGARDIDIWNKFRGNGARAVIITKDDDFIDLAEIFAMKAMMDAGRTHAVSIENNPFVIHINVQKIDKDDVIEAFRKRAQIFVKEAMREERRMAYMRLNKNGIFKGPSLPEIFEKHAGERSDFDIANPIVTPKMVNIRKLNKKRIQNDLPGISYEDYPDLAQ